MSQQSSGTRSTSGPTPGACERQWARILGPTLIAYGTEDRRTGSLTPSAGCRAVVPGTRSRTPAPISPTCRPRPSSTETSWVITGQKVWTSYAQWADWCFVVCPHRPRRAAHKGLSYLLVPMDQPGVEVRPIQADHGDVRVQRGVLRPGHTDADLVVGEVNDGWRVALATSPSSAAWPARDIVGIPQGARPPSRARHKEREHHQQGDPPAAGRGWIRLYSSASTPAFTRRRGRPGAPPQASISKLFWANMASRSR